MRDEDVHRLQRQIKQLYRRVQREQPVAEGLSMTALQVVTTLERSPEALRPSELSAELQMTSSNVAAALRALEARNLVQRRPDPADGRKAFIELTPHARQVISDIRRSRHAWLQDAVDDLLSPQEQHLLMQAGQLMERLANHSASTD
jgi:DNA-binding MarR family transcriptional regulator